MFDSLLPPLIQLIWHANMQKNLATLLLRQPRDQIKPADLTSGEAVI